MTLISIPFLGEVSAGSLVFAGVAGLIGYVIGSQLKSAIKVAMIILFIVALFGLITPAMLAQLAEYIAAIKPIATSMLVGQDEMNLSLGAFIVGFIIGLVKG